MPRLKVNMSHHTTGGVSDPVSSIMTRNPIQHVVPSSINEIISILIKKGITGIPLHDQNGRYVGMISRKDIFRNFRETQLAMIMRRAESARENDTVESAAKLLLRQGRRHMAVTDSDGRIAGIVTPQNFLPYIASHFGNLDISQFISKSIIPIWDETPLPLFFRITQMSEIYSFPVVDRNGVLTGIVTDRDIFEKVSVETTLIRAESGIADDEDPWSWGGIRNVFSYMVRKGDLNLPDIPVRDIAVKNPECAFENTKISKVVEIMLRGNYNQVPILDATGRLKSMLFDIDLLGVFLV